MVLSSRWIKYNFGMTYDMTTKLSTNRIETFKMKIIGSKLKLSLKGVKFKLRKPYIEFVIYFLIIWSKRRCDVDENI